MRSKRLELLEAQQNQKPSTTTKRRETPQNKRLSTAKSRGGKAKQVVTDAVDGRRENEIVTDAADEAPPNTAVLEKLRSSTRKACVAINNGSWADEIVNIAVDASINAVALKKQRLSAKKSRSAVGNVRRAKEIGTDAVDETLDAVSLEKQMPPATKSRSAFVNEQREKEVVTDAVDEGLNHGSATEIGTDAVDERVGVVALEEQRSAATNPFSASVAGSRRAKGIGTDAVVGERLNAVALEKQRSLTIKPRITFVIGRRPKEIVTDTADARLNPDALEKQMSPTTRPSSAFADRNEASDVLTDPEDDRLNAFAGMLDARSDAGDEDTDTLDTRSNIRDEDADMLDTGGDTRDEDVDILDADGNGEMQFAEDQWLPFNSDEDADILDADENGDMHILDDESLPTNPEQVAGSSRKRNRETVQRQVTDLHRESYNANCTNNGQGSIYMPSGRIPITFDKYGRPCDVGSMGFATDIGKIVRACCRPAIESWKKVPDSVKDNIWKNVIHMYAVPEIYKPNVLSRAGTSWRNWKHNLRLEMDEQRPIAERKENMPWRLITNKEDWESFVDFCNTDEDRKRRAAGRKAYAAVGLIQKCGRKGIYRKIYEMEKENPTGEVNRAAIFVDTHISKTVNDPKMRLVQELVEANPDGQKDIDHDAVALVYGRDSSFIKGMGGGISRTMLRNLAGSSEILRRVQQENKSLQSDIHLLRAQLGVHSPSNTSTPSNQYVAQTQNRTPPLPNQSVPYTQNRTSTPSYHSAPQTQIRAPAPSNQSAPHTQNRASGPSNQFVSQTAEASNLPARSRLAPPASNFPARVRVATPASNLPTRSRLAPPSSNLPARSSLTPRASNLVASSCFIKNFKGRTIALGSINTADLPMEDVHSLIIEEIFDRNAELFDEDGKLGDIMIGGVINWPKACVVSNLPANSCFIRNFKRRTIALGSINTAMEDVYSVIVKEIYDRDAELFDEDGKLGDIMIGDLINWPKACIKPC